MPDVSRLCISKVCQIEQLGFKMKHHGQFQCADHFRERRQVQTLIADLQRIVDILDADIGFEEQQVGVTDLASPEYPMARALRARRDNLSATICDLLSSLSKATAGATARSLV